MTNICSNLAEKIQPSSDSHRNFLSVNFPNSVSFNPATETEIIEITHGIQPGKIRFPWRLQKSKWTFSEPFAKYDVNLSITRGIVSGEIKIARVVHSYKADDRAVFTNYRPISILPSFSNRFQEKVMCRSARSCVRRREQPLKKVTFSQH